MEFPWRVKLRQAERHLRRFKAECDAYVRDSDLGFKYEVDADAGRINVRLQASFEPPMQLGATIGDVLHNLRSALDAAAWETCQRAGVPPERESGVYFPIGTDPNNWKSLAGSQLPGVAAAHLTIFEELQPWFRDQQARKLGIDIPAADADKHPLARLHDLAKRDRHRVPHPVLARAGNTWLGAPDGVALTAYRVDPLPWSPGSVVLAWEVRPADRISDVHPAGEAIMALSEESAVYGHSAVDELSAMESTVAEALRRIEIEVLEAVTQEQLATLKELRAALEDHAGRLSELQNSSHIIDAAYIEKSEGLRRAVEAAKECYSKKWSEVFE